MPLTLKQDHSNISLLSFFVRLDVLNTLIYFYKLDVNAQQCLGRPLPYFNLITRAHGPGPSQHESARPSLTPSSEGREPTTTNSSAHHLLSIFS